MGMRDGGSSRKEDHLGAGVDLVSLRARVFGPGAMTYGLGSGQFIFLHVLLHGMDHAKKSWLAC